MSDIHEINKAVVAHGLWKLRLRMAVSSGKTEFAIETIRDDSECEFGKWLNGQTLTASDKISEEYKTVKDFHARFHGLAAQVAELAVTGKKSDAEKLLAADFETASVRLTSAMTVWRGKSR